MAIERKCRIGILFLLTVLWLGFWGVGSWGGVDPKPPAQVTQVLVVPYYPVPERMELCGETVPLDSSDIRERFDREFTSIVYSHGRVYLWLKRIERYFPWVEKELSSRGLPDDLKYLAVAESDLMISAISPAGAAGPWQFVSPTAARFGLNQTPAVDERYDFETAASGAFKYLETLHGTFQNWTLALAAYNCGEKRVQDEMRKQKVKSYYFLKLPNETERYIPRILAIKEVLSHPEKYGFNLPKGAGYRPFSVQKVTINLPGAIPVEAAAEAAGITYREFKVLNPFLVSDFVPGGNLTVNVPEGRGRDFQKKIAAIKAEHKPVCILHKVARGDTLSGIALKYNAAGLDICRWNNLEGTDIRLGQVLKIYR